MVQRLGVLILLAGAFGALLRAQEAVPAPEPAEHSQHEHSVPAATASAWTWSADANVFVGFNYQDRRYFDFAAWESQNWIMGSAARSVGAGRLTVESMLSLEPLTVGHGVYRVDDGLGFGAPGSPQVFQTGETYKGLPITDYQHPHDFLMGLGATWERTSGRLSYAIGADLVGSPTLGPVPFMHRESGRDNPQVPLTHHLLDSTHSTPGVVRGGIRLSEWSLEASAFRGREPDEHRYEIDRPQLDSWAVRLGWRKGNWDAQFSGGHLKTPEAYSPYDQTRLTASLGYRGSLRSMPLTMTGAWGRTLEYTPYRPVSQGGLVEWDLRATRTFTTYGRVELVRKEVLGVHVHTLTMPPHPTFLSDIGAFTGGVVQDLTWFGLSRWGRVGIGGDVTFYDMSADLQPIYGGSRSFHAFVRWRPPATAGAAGHMHH